MIINPQLFNYRLIIGSLVVAILILGTLSYTSYRSLKENQEFIEQEKNLVESELSEMISSYQAIDVKSVSIAKQLEETKFKITSILDSVKATKPNALLISKYKAQIKVLKNENAHLLAFIDSLEVENTSLKVETKKITDRLVKTKAIANTLKTKKEKLIKENKGLKENLQKAKTLEKTTPLSLVNFTVKGVKRLTSTKKIIETESVNKTNKFQVCFTLLKNKALENGKKELYIQILDSKMNVVSNKGKLNYGKYSLIYSEKKLVDYRNQDLNICSIIDKGSETLIKGNYFVSVFYKGKKLGSSNIELN